MVEFYGVIGNFGGTWYIYLGSPIWYLRTQPYLRTLKVRIVLPFSDINLTHKQLSNHWGKILKDTVYQLSLVKLTEGSQSSTSP